MLVILWFMVGFFTVGAREQHETTDYEVEQVLDGSDLNDETYNPVESKIRPSIWLPRGSYLSYPETHWSSTENPETHWSSTTEYTTVDHSEGQTDEYENYDGYSKPSENDYDHKYPVQVGSIRGIPGINFPDYKDIPLTDFRCSDKVYVPGFYADMQTGCQVFHVCWPHRRESFLCPVGTIFNQAILACDYWYSSNCSLAFHYYEVNAVPPHADPDYKETASLGSMIDGLLGVGKSDSMLVSSRANSDGVSKENVDLSEILKFLPVKTKVVVFPETAENSKIIAKASIGKTKESKVVKQIRQKPQIHEVKPKYIGVRRPHDKIAPVQNVAPMKTELSHREIDRIIKQVLSIVKKILSVTEGPLTVLDKGLQKNHEYKNRKYPPLIKLNPRFIMKPAKLSKHKRNIQSTTETPEVQKPRLISKPQSNVQPFPSKKYVVSDFVSRSRIPKYLPQRKRL